MPELPDITVYIDALRPRVIGTRLRSVSIRSPFVLRTFDPPINECDGRTVTGIERLGKRIVFMFDDDVFLVIHLMIAGRLLWKPPPITGSTGRGKIDIAAFFFERGTLVLTEAGTSKRASIHVVRGADALHEHDPGGLEVLGDRACTAAQFTQSLRLTNRTVKRALTDPRTFSGIGNAYSDEILHAARLGPLKLTGRLTDDECTRLFTSVGQTLATWINKLRAEFGITDDDEGRFPGTGQITAFRPDFAVHGKFGKPCPVCGSPVQRIIYATNECNYCATCQTGGKVFADRSMSRLLKGDWPDRIEDWE